MRAAKWDVCWAAHRCPAWRVRREFVALQSDTTPRQTGLFFLLAQLVAMVSHTPQAAILRLLARFSAHPGDPRYSSDSTMHFPELTMLLGPERVGLLLSLK